VQPEVQVEILEIALTRLVADRTVERVVGEEKLQNGSSALLRLGARGVHGHPFADRCVAGDLELGKFLYLDETDAEIAGDGECGVVAVSRNEDAQLLRGLNHRGSVGDADFPAVDAQLGHATACRFPALRPARMYVSNSSRNLAM